MKVKKLVTIFLSVLLVILISVLTVSAVPAPHYMGNVDCGGEITVKDATLIQKNVAGIESFTKLQMVLADVDRDGKITVKDATTIQKHCAGISSYPVDMVWDSNYVDSFNTDFDSGKAMVGVPVTFTVRAFATPKPISYEYYINGEVVGEVTSENTFTCAFDEAGVYEVKVVIYNDFGTTSRATICYEVVDTYASDTVKIKAFYHNRTEKPFDNRYGNSTVFTADAMFGSGEYEYAFYVDGELVQDFSEKSTYTHHWFEEQREYTLSVEVRDTVTGDIDSESMVILVEEPVMV